MVVALFKNFFHYSFFIFKQMHSILSNLFGRNRQIGLHPKDFYIASSRANVSSKKLVPLECSQNLNAQWLSLKQKQKTLAKFGKGTIKIYQNQGTVF